ncbi:MAG: ribokinase [Solirubrobacteraceae bacterium]|nr:ribokinase [Solirubrobacteraceae bacterium]
MRVAVAGHIEWIWFARVERVPVAGEIAHASDSWEEAAGGGAVAAVQLVKLAGGADFFTAVGADELGRRSVAQLEAQGVTVYAAAREGPQRRGFTFLDAAGERAITVVGERLAPHGADPLPWERLADTGAVYFTAGDADALRTARAARVLVGTPRARDALATAGVVLDALVLSATDADERAWAAGLDPPPRLVVYTEGAKGGRFAASEGTSGTYAATPLPGPLVDAYGCGDSFAAGLTYALGAGEPIDTALGLAARCGAACLTGRGPFAGQLTLPG